MLGRFEQFSLAVSGIYRYIQKLERDEMVKLGYKGAFAQYLVAMSHHDAGVTAAQLCEICDKDKAAVSRVMGEMQALGLITRDTSGGRYRARLLLTEKGKQAAGFVRSRAETAVEAVGKRLTDEQRQMLYASMDLIARNLQVLSREGIPQEQV